MAASGQDEKSCKCTEEVTKPDECSEATPMAARSTSHDHHLYTAEKEEENLKDNERVNLPRYESSEVTQPQDNIVNGQQENYTADLAENNTGNTEQYVTTSPQSVNKRDESLHNLRPLSPDLVARAEMEVNEKDHWRDRDIEALREMVTNERSLHCPLDDAFLLRFLRARRFDYDGALSLLGHYYGLRRWQPQLFAPLTSLRALFETRLVDLAAGRSAKDESVLLLRLGQWAPQQWPFEHVLAAAIITMEWLTEHDDRTQINGMVWLVDMTGFGWTQFRQFGPTLANKCAYVMEKCLPIRINAIYVVHESALADIAFTLIKPFLSEEMRERIHFCGSNLPATVHTHIDPHLLPVEFGGKLQHHRPDRLLHHLQHFERRRVDNEAHFHYGLATGPLTTASVREQRTCSTGKCAPSGCGTSSSYGLVDELPLGSPLGPESPLELGGGSEVRNFFRKSQTCNGYLFDYYTNTSSID